MYLQDFAKTSKHKAEEEAAFKNQLRDMWQTLHPDKKPPAKKAKGAAAASKGPPAFKDLPDHSIPLETAVAYLPKNCNLEKIS